ncbi:MAG: universal stress protein [Pseudomonadota bacterium]
MSTHILCAIDLTHEDDARLLLAETAKIAAQQGAAISIMTVLPDYGMSFVGSFFQEGTLKEAAQAALEALHRLEKEMLADHKVQSIVKIGSAYEEILQTAEACEADLIIVGAHKPDLADRIIGPNAARVARYAKVSVLVLRI